MLARIWMIVPIIALLFASCGDGSSSSTDGAAGADPAAEGEGSGPDLEEVTVRAVGLRPYEGVPDTLPAGDVTFLFEQEDDGRLAHDFRIEELDVGTRKIAPGQSEKLTVTLEPGTYTYFCSVGIHRERGMEGTFAVE